MDDGMNRDDEHYFPSSHNGESVSIDGVTGRVLTRPDAYTRSFEDGPWRVECSLDSNPRKDKNVFLVRTGYGARHAALKVINVYEQKRDNPLPEDERAKRYATVHRESEIMDRLKGCANIVTVYGHLTFSWHDDEHEGEDLVILMEYLPDTLDSLYRDWLLTKWSLAHSDSERNEDAYDEGFVLKVGHDLCAALGQCVRAGKGRGSSSGGLVFHRDIKPQNIFYDEDLDVFKLGDFGISRSLEDERQQVSTVSLTPTYAAPERLRGELYDIRADIYSVGLVLYWLCNEARLPENRLIGTPAGILPIPNPKMRNLPPAAHGTPKLRAIIDKACSYDPQDRYQTVEELAAALETLDDGQSSDGASSGETAVYDETKPYTATMLAELSHSDVQEDERGNESKIAGATVTYPSEDRLDADRISTVAADLPHDDHEDGHAAGSSSHIVQHAGLVEESRRQRAAQSRRRWKLGVIAAVVLIVAGVFLTDYSNRVSPDEASSTIAARIVPLIWQAESFHNRSA